MKDPKVLLEHISESILLLEGYCEGKSFSDFKSDVLFQDAVLRRLQIIGEAAKSLPSAFKAKHGDAEWKEAAAMRNILVHQYFVVDLRVIWETLKRDIPPLKKKVSELLEGESEGA